MKHPLKPIAQMTFGEIQKEFSILRNISNKLGMKINLLKEIVSKLKSASPFDLAPLINEVETKINDLGDFKLSDKTDRPKQMTGKTFKTKEKVKEYLKTKPLTTFELYELLVKDGILLSKEENDWWSGSLEVH